MSFPPPSSFLAHVPCPPLDLPSPTLSSLSPPSGLPSFFPSIHPPSFCLLLSLFFSFVSFILLLLPLLVHAQFARPPPLLLPSLSLLRLSSSSEKERERQSHKSRGERGSEGGRILASSPLSLRRSSRHKLGGISDLEGEGGGVFFSALDISSTYVGTPSGWKEQKAVTGARRRKRRRNGWRGSFSPSHSATSSIRHHQLPFFSFRPVSVPLSLLSVGLSRWNGPINSFNFESRDTRGSGGKKRKESTRSETEKKG